MSKPARKVEKPRAEYGSDVIVDMLKAFEFEYIAVNPGATFRGLHDSLVNYGGNRLPEMILCPHEEITVALAHGYARACGKPMAAAVHNIVGLQHAAMAIYNAWCDRLPVIVMGGTGPMDTALRRPWIDWVHTALVQGNLVRDFVKWVVPPGVARCDGPGLSLLGQRGVGEKARRRDSDAVARPLSGPAADAGAGRRLREDNQMAPRGQGAGDRRGLGRQARGGLQRAR